MVRSGEEAEAGSVFSTTGKISGVVVAVFGSAMMISGVGGNSGVMEVVVMPGSVGSVWAGEVGSVVGGVVSVGPPRLASVEAGGAGVSSAGVSTGGASSARAAGLNKKLLTKNSWQRMRVRDKSFLEVKDGIWFILTSKEGSVKLTSPLAPLLGKERGEGKIQNKFQASIFKHYYGRVFFLLLFEEEWPSPVRARTRWWENRRRLGYIISWFNRSPAVHEHRGRDD